MGRKKQTYTFALTAEEKLALEKLAIFFNCKWGEKANVSELLSKIAQGKISLVESGSVISFSDREEFEERILQLTEIVEYLKKV